MVEKNTVITYFYRSSIVCSATSTVAALPSSLPPRASPLAPPSRRRGLRWVQSLYRGFAHRFAQRFTTCLYSVQAFGLPLQQETRNLKQETRNLKQETRNLKLPD